MDIAKSKVDVIVPIYNVEEYIGRCIDSIERQSISEIEGILIDDGSVDRSGEIADGYLKIDSRLTVIHTTNKGVSAARNIGMRMSTGAYVGFVDSDDWIEPKMYEILKRRIETDGTDIACCNWNDVLMDGTALTHRMDCIDSVMSREVFLNHIFDIPYSILGIACNKLFKREKIIQEFPIGCRVGEDTLFTIQYCKTIKQASYCDEPFYNIYIRTGSATRSEKDIYSTGIIEWGQVLSIVKNENKKTRNLAERMYLDRCLMYSNETGELGTNARRYLIHYVKRHFFRIMVNREIYWKTRFLYFLILMGVHKPSLKQ